MIIQCPVAFNSIHLRYYTNILYDAMKEDQPYDSIPNFTVRVGRHEWYLYGQLMVSRFGAVPPRQYPR